MVRIIPILISAVASSLEFYLRNMVLPTSLLGSRLIPQRLEQDRNSIPRQSRSNQSQLCPISPYNLHAGWSTQHDLCSAGNRKKFEATDANRAVTLNSRVRHMSGAGLFKSKWCFLGTLQKAGIDPGKFLSLGPSKAFPIGSSHEATCVDERVEAISFP